MPKMDLIKKYLFETFRKHDLKNIFHLPGSVLVPLYDGLQEFGPILMKHPASAGFAADALARLKGLGVAMVAQGPGLAGAIQPIINSWKDHVPTVTITGKPHYMDGNPGAWQAFPAKEVLSPVVKAFIDVHEGKNSKHQVEAAFDIAMTHPKGPVVLNICESPEPTGEKIIKTPSPLRNVPNDFLKDVMDALKKSSRPIFLAGRGAIDEADEFARLVHKLNIPVATTVLARGIVDERDMLCLGPVGTIGRELANSALSNADVVIAFGTRLSDNVLQPMLASTGRPVIFQIAGSENDRSKIIDIKRFCVCTVKSVIKSLGDTFTRSFDVPWATNEKVKPKNDVMAQLLGNANSKTVVVADAGTITLHLYKSFLPIKPNHLLFQWGIGTMGSSLPSAVGASFSGVDKVMAVMGDGGFFAGSNELTTVAENKLPVKIVVFNNLGLEFIRNIQRKMIGKESNTSFIKADIAAFGEAAGIRSHRIEKGAGLTPEVLKMLNDDEPLLLDVAYDFAELNLSGTQWDKKQA